MNNLPAIEIVDLAIERLKQITGFEIEINVCEPINRHFHFQDGELEIKTGGEIYNVKYVVKRWLNNAIIGVLRNELVHNNENIVIITNYVNKIMAENLKTLNIQFIDGAGNAYIKMNKFFVFINGKKDETKQYEKKETRRIFEPAGLKLLFALLCNDDIINKPYRQIANLVGVANGTVGWVMRDLKILGHLIDGENGKRLLNKNELIKKWVEYYPIKLRNKLNIKRYRTEMNNWPENYYPELNNVFLGGELAAAKITNYLRPKDIILYTQGNTNKLIVQMKMIQDQNGNIEIAEKFWNFPDKNDQQGTVPDLLIYADLMATGDNRNIETGRIIYEQRIKRHF